MKKFFLVAAMAAMTFAVVSCGNDPVDKFKDYSKQQLEAFANQDLEKVKEIQQEETAWYNSLSDDDKQKVDEYVKETTGAVIDAAKGAADAAGEVDESMKDASEAIDQATDAAKKMTDAINEAAGDNAEH